jgi:hypothetical protein
MGRIGRSTRAYLVTLVVPLLLLVPGAVCAEPAGATPRYETAPECPERSEWVERLHAKLPSSPAARAEADALPVRIVRRPRAASGNEYEGAVGAEGAEAGRLVRGTSCREVFEALVLVAVLGLDTTRSEPSGSARASSAPLGGLPAEPPPVGGIDEPVATASTGGDTPLGWGAVGLVLVQSGIAPRPSLDVGAGLVARWSFPGFEPWLLLAVYTAAEAQTVRVAGASARLEHTAVRALGCPWRYPATGWLALRPCAGLDVGRCRGEGSGVSGPSNNGTLWLAARTELRVEFSIYDGLSLGAAGGAALPLVRPRFYFEPGAVVFQAPAFGLEAGAFAAWLF